MVRVCLLIVSGLFTVCGIAQTGAMLSGRVIDENHAAVPMASLRFQPQSARASNPLQITTGPAGDFRVNLPERGRFVVTVVHAGFFPLNNVPVESGDGSQSVQFVLNHLTELSTSIRVESDQVGIDPQQTESQQALSHLDLVNIPYRGRDLSHAFTLMPGVLEDSSGGVHFSGSAVNQVLYTLDGFNITDPLTGTLKARLNVDAVRSLEYASARYSPEFGKGSAGAVAVATTMGSDALRYNATNFVPGVDTAGGLHIGTWSPRFQVSGPIVKKRAWFSESAEATYSNVILPDVKGRNSTHDLKLDNLLRTQFNLTGTDPVFVSLLMNSWRAPASGLGALDPYSTTLDKRSRTWFASVKHNHYFHNGAVLEWGYGEERVWSRQVPQGTALYLITPSGRAGNAFLDSTEDSSRKQFIANYSPRALHAWGTHQIKAGGDLDRLDYVAHNTRTGYEVWGLNGHRLNRITFTGSGVFRRPNLEAAGYLMDTWRVRAGLTVEAGVRQDWDELLRNAVFSPRLAVSWSPFHWRNTKLSAGYAITRDSTSLPVFSRPLDQSSITVNYDADGQVTSGPSRTYFTAGTRPLRTPKYRNWSAALEKRLPRDIRLTAGYTRKHGEDGLTYLAVPVPDDPSVNGKFELSNFRRDVFDSAEIVLRQAFGAGYEWQAGYTRSRALSNSVISLSVDRAPLGHQQRGPHAVGCAQPPAGLGSLSDAVARLVAGLPGGGARRLSLLGGHRLWRHRG